MSTSSLPPNNISMRSRRCSISFNSISISVRIKISLIVTTYQPSFIPDKPIFRQVFRLRIFDCLTAHISFYIFIFYTNVWDLRPEIGAFVRNFCHPFLFQWYLVSHHPTFIDCPIRRWIQDSPIPIGLRAGSVTKGHISIFPVTFMCE